MPPAELTVHTHCDHGRGSSDKDKRPAWDAQSSQVNHIDRGQRIGKSCSQAKREHRGYVRNSHDGGSNEDTTHPTGRSRADQA